MQNFNSLYPNIEKLFDRIPNRDETFLFDRVENIEYPFWDELEYFLSNSGRLGNINEILRKLQSEAPLSLNNDKAWGKQRDFRSAQFEITAIFLIEKYLDGKVVLIPEDSVPTPDFETNLKQGNFMVEAKAQSGQQHGDKHPRHDDLIRFNPKEELDLRSWLFEERISSRDGKPMKPQVLAAEMKKADILICQTDYIKTRNSLQAQISILCPENQFIDQISLKFSNRNPIDVFFYQATYPCTRQPEKLKEIWLCNLSSSRYRLVVLSCGNAVLFKHLKYKR